MRSQTRIALGVALVLLALGERSLAEPADSMDVLPRYQHAPADLCTLGAIGVYIDDRISLSATKAYRGFLWTISLSANYTRKEVPEREISAYDAINTYGDRETRTRHFAVGFAFGPHYRLGPRSHLTLEGSVVLATEERRFVDEHSQGDERGKVYYTKDGRQHPGNIGITVGTILLFPLGDWWPGDGGPKWHALLLGIGTSYRRLVTFKLQYGLGG